MDLVTLGLGLACVGLGLSCFHIGMLIGRWSTLREIKSEKNSMSEAVKEPGRVIMRVGNSELVMTKEEITLTVHQNSHPRFA